MTIFRNTFHEKTYQWARPSALLSLALALGISAVIGLVCLFSCAALKSPHDSQATPASSAPVGPPEQAHVADSPAAQSGAWVEANVTHSGDSHTVLVYLPASYPLHAPYPVAYLLHGHGQDPWWWQRSDVKSQADSIGLVLVAVQGDDSDIVASWYSGRADLPWPGGPDWSVSFYDWFFSGVLPWVEGAYDVRTDTGGRVIVGFSMGGKGAFSLAGHRPDLFSAAVEIAGVMDLTDFSWGYEIPEVYGPLAGREIIYAADSPVELAPNLKGVSLTLLHGAADGMVSREQSRKMSRALDELGYPHLWEEIPGQDHEPVSTYEINRAFGRVAESLQVPYSPPVAWRYRFADDLTRQIYGTTITKTDPLTWTEIRGVTSTSWSTDSGDAFSMETAPLYTPLSDYDVTRYDLSKGTSTIDVVTANRDGRLLLALPAGRFRVTIGAAQMLERIYVPLALRTTLDAALSAGPPRRSYQPGAACPGNSSIGADGKR